MRRIRRLSLSIAAALLLAGVGTAPASGTGDAVPVPQVIYYYSSSSYSNLVGVGEWTCNYQYVQHWGTSTSYSQHFEQDCDIDPWE